MTFIEEDKYDESSLYQLIVKVKDIQKVKDFYGINGAEYKGDLYSTLELYDLADVPEEIEKLFQEDRYYKQRVFRHTDVLSVTVHRYKIPGNYYYRLSNDNITTDGPSEYVGL